MLSLIEDWQSHSSFLVPLRSASHQNVLIIGRCSHLKFSGQPDTPSPSESPSQNLLPMLLVNVNSTPSAHTISRHDICHTFDEQHTFTWHVHSFLAKDSNFLPREIEHCADPQEVSLGYLAEPTTCTGYEPKDLAGNEDFRVKPLFFHRPRKASTYDSAESSATPHEADLDYEQNWCSAGFTTVPTRARSKCGPIASLSLCKRKLDVKFISRSEEYRETGRVVFKQKQVE